MYEFLATLLDCLLLAAVEQLQLSACSKFLIALLAYTAGVPKTRASGQMWPAGGLKVACLASWKIQ